MEEELKKLAKEYAVNLLMSSPDEAAYDATSYDLFMCGTTTSSWHIWEPFQDYPINTLKEIVFVEYDATLRLLQRSHKIGCAYCKDTEEKLNIANQTVYAQMREIERLNTLIENHEINESYYKREIDKLEVIREYLESKI